MKYFIQQCKKLSQIILLFFCGRNMASFLFLRMFPPEVFGFAPSFNSSWLIQTRENKTITLDEK